jgi:hypothetical protein
MGQTADWMNPDYEQGDANNDDTSTSNATPTAYTPVGAIIGSGTASEGEEVEGAEEIRASIEQTRSEMSETINAIQEKLSPQHLMEQAKDSIRDATVGRVEEMVSNVGDKVGEMAGQAGDTAGGLLETIKQNPMPAALAGVGLAWLFMKNQDSSSGSQGAHHSRSQYPQYPPSAYPSYPSYPEYRPTGSGRQGSNGGGSILDTVKQNPIPFGLAGLGLWAVFGNKGSSSSSSSSRTQGRYQAQGYGGYGSQNAGNQRYGNWNQDGSQQSLGETLGQVGGKIGEVASGAGEKVGEVTGQAASTVGDIAGNVGSAVGNVAGQVGGTVGDVAGAVGSTAGDIFDVVRRNPLQTAVAGLSIGWLLMNGRDGSRSGDEIIHKAQNVVGDTIGQAGSTVGEVAGQAGSKVGEIAGQAQGQVQRTLMSDPLVVGAAVMAIGAAVGLALPETEQERQIMGQARDTLMEKVQGVAQDTMQKVQSVAQEVGNTVKDTVQTEAEAQGLIQSQA